MHRLLKRIPRNGLFTSFNRKKWQRAKSGKFSGYGIAVVVTLSPFVCLNKPTSRNHWKSCHVAKFNTSSLLQTQSQMR